MWVIGILLIVAGIAVAADAVFLSGITSPDLPLYACYAHAFWQGPTPHTAGWSACAPLWHGNVGRFHTFPVEYPAPALAIFSLPLLMPWWSYAIGYPIWIALSLIAASAALAWKGRLEAAIALPTYSLLAGWYFVLDRYDLVPGLCVLGAFLLLERGRSRAATAALAIGTLLKLFPIVLLPVLLIACRREEGRWRLDLAALFAIICAAGFVPALLLNAPGALSPLHVESARALHIESLPGDVSWLASRASLGPSPGVDGGPVPVMSYNSLSIVHGAATAWSVFFILLALVGAIVALRRTRRGDDSPARTAIVLLLLVLLAGKVFSPQYLLWVLPLVAVQEGLRLPWLALCALATFIMHDYYTLPLASLPWSSGFLAIITVRNLLLGGMIALYLALPGDRRTPHWPTRPAWRYLWSDYLTAK